MNIFFTTVFLIITSISFSTLAGSAQDKERHFSTEEITTFAKNVELFAAKEGARAFIIARVGRPPSDLPDGVDFTHTAIAIYSSITLDSGEKVKGYAIHNLYQKEEETDKSELVLNYPVDFFWGANSLKAGIIIPSPELQQRIIEVIAQGGDKVLHNENYSVISNPFNNTYQNCTEHTLNIINAGIYKTNDISQLKSNTEQHFKPRNININPVKLMIGDWFVDDVSLKDHDGKVYTTTFSSIVEYLAKNELVNKSIVLNSDRSIEQLLSKT